MIVEGAYRLKKVPTICCNFQTCNRLWFAPEVDGTMPPLNILPLGNSIQIGNRKLVQCHPSREDSCRFLIYTPVHFSDIGNRVSGVSVLELVS